MVSIRYKVQDTEIKEIYKVVVYRFTVGEEVESIERIWEWKQTDAAEFVIKYSESAPEIKSHFSYPTMEYEYIILAEIEKKKLSEFYLRFDKQQK
jgi:hypothetical protein